MLFDRVNDRLSVFIYDLFREFYFEKKERESLKGRCKRFFCDPKKQNVFFLGFNKGC